MPWNKILDKLPRWAFALAAVGAVILVMFQMLRGDALMCSDGAIFAKSCDSVRQNAFPSNAVIAFDGPDCPIGWEEYQAANGRFIVGSGRHAQRDQYGVELAELQPGMTDGSRTHQLTVDEIPSHTHTYTFSTGYDSAEEADFTREEFGDKDIFDEPTGSAGGDQPHNNMPPYVVLRICRSVSALSD